MKTLKILLIMQGVSLLFLFVPYARTDNPLLLFPFDGTLIYPRQYAWFFFEHINWIVILFRLRYLESKKYTLAIDLFIVMEILVMVEFMLSYHRPWFSLAFLQIGLSHFFIIFKAIIYYKWMKKDG